jgi:hypothetical protein
MNQTFLRNLPEVSKGVRPRGISTRFSKFRRSRWARSMALLMAGSVLAIALPLYAQRGGGASASGASAGGGHFGGGGASPSSGGGGSRASGAGGAGHATSAGSGASSGGNVSGGSGRGSSSTSGGKGDTAARRSGFSAAVRHFFGLSSASKSRVTEQARLTSGITSSTSFLGKRTGPVGLPAAFGRVHLIQAPSPFGESRPSAEPAISAPPRPIQPHPRRIYTYSPVGYNYGCYGCGFDFGFGLGPLFYFGYWNWDPPFWHTSTQSAAAMLLYMQDGSAFEVTDYWVDGDTLNYVTVDGIKSSIALATLNLQRTVDANARVGLRFTLDRLQGGRPFERVTQQPEPANPSQRQPDPGGPQIEVQRID